MQMQRHSMVGKKDLPSRITRNHGYSVTVPGCVGAWIDAVEYWRTLPLSKILLPSVHLAHDGFVTGPITSEL